MAINQTMTAELFFQQVPFILPEITLAAGALIIMLIGAFMGDKGSRLVTWLCVATIVAAGSMAVLHMPPEQVVVFSGSSFSGLGAFGYFGHVHHGFGP